MGKEQYVMSYFLEHSNNGIHWSRYTDDENIPYKVNGGSFMWKL